MATIAVHSLCKSFAGNDLFSDVSFDVSEGSRLAVVGPNGCGKSTLLKIIAGKQSADTGSVSVTGGAKVGYLAQELVTEELDRGLLSWVLDVFPSWSDFWRRFEEAADKGDETAIARLGREQAGLEQQFGYNLEHKAEAVLAGLGFADEDFIRPLGALSGGWRERAKLARVILLGSDVLLLDEPTNHLDLEALTWLEEYVLSFPGLVIFVVHDRAFLDNVSSHILDLGAVRPVLRRGNFSQYLAWREETEKVRVRQEANLAAKIEDHMSYVRRFRVKARKASQAQSKLKQVEKLKSELDGLKAEKKRRSLSFSLPEPDRGDKSPLGASHLSFAFPESGKLWPPLSFQIFRGQKVALAGPNGAGKSTLLKLLVGELKPVSGEVYLGPHTTMGYYSQHQTEILDLEKEVLSQLRSMADPHTTEEELRSVLGLFMLGEDYFHRPVKKLSGGEKSRLVLAGLFLARANLLVLDEPTNHLDLESREALVEALKAYQGTILMVAHDRYLLSEVADEVWALGNSGLARHMGGFSEYDRERRKSAEEANGKMSSRRAEAAKGKRLDKEEKRRQAEIRNAISKDLKPRKDRYAKLESRLEAHMNTLASMEERLADPATYEKKDEFMRLTSEYKQAKELEEELFESLAALEEEIAALEKKRDTLLEAG